MTFNSVMLSIGIITLVGILFGLTILLSGT